jgi:hypothetical protein
MTAAPSTLPTSYGRALRTLVRYAAAAGIVGLLAGLAFQESAKKLTWEMAGPGLHLESLLTLALVHGHVFTMATILPLVLGGALVLARLAGGAEVGGRALAWLVRGYLPFAAASLVLQLVKGYHILLSVRHGATDLAAVDAAFLGGSHVLRYALFGAAHTGMGVTLGVFLVALWRSLGRERGTS